MGRKRKYESWTNVNIPSEFVKEYLEKLSGSDLGIFLKYAPGFIAETEYTNDAEQYLLDHPEFNRVMKLM